MMRTIGACLLQLGLVGLAVAQQPDGVGSAAPATAAPRLPDAFYTPPPIVPPKPGKLIRVEEMTDRVLPRGARAWRILYTTTLAENVSAVASAVVLAAANLPPGPRPVISWSHGTLGITPRCAPSLTSAPVSGIPAVDQIVGLGWVLIAADYPGLGTKGTSPYLIGQGEARSALDAVRAVKQMHELRLQRRTIVWGHSQGGHAALWQGIIAPRYAPDVNVIAVAADAPASNVPELVASLDGTAGGASLSAYVATAFSAFYSDVEFKAVVRKEARDEAQQLAELCANSQDAATRQSLVKQLGGKPVLVDSRRGPLGERLDQNVPRAPIPVPLLISQGLSDAVVDPKIQTRFVEQRCAAGQSLEYWTFVGQDHGSIVAAHSPLAQRLVRWTQDRLADEPLKAGCRRLTFERP